MKRTTLLVDGDILAFRSVAANFHEVEWEPAIWSYWTDIDAAKDAMKGLMDKLTSCVEPDEVVLAITGSGNFRRDLCPSYKAHRKAKPPGYRAFQDWLLTEFRTYERDGLEADDCLGILMTADDLMPGLKVLWSGDKDLKQIAGTHLDASDVTQPRLHEVTELDGDILHAVQTLTGDTTDGYPGCPGIGPAKAAKIVAEAKGDLGKLWGLVEAAYVKAGLTRDDMILQARLARILRASDFCFETRKPILWTPPTLA